MAWFVVVLRGDSLPGYSLDEKSREGLARQDDKGRTSMASVRGLPDDILGDDEFDVDVAIQLAPWTSLNSLSDLLISQRRTSKLGLTSAGISGSTKASRSARWNSRAMLIRGPSA